MLETNTFRNLMLIAGVFIFGIIMAGLFTYPVVEFDSTNRDDQDMYQRLMVVEDKEYLTAMDIALYYIKAKPRGDVRHY